MRPLSLVLAIALAPLPACAPDVACQFEAVYQTEQGGILSVDRCSGALMLGDGQRPDRFLSAATGIIASLAWADDDIETEMRQGRYLFEGSFGRWVSASEGSFEGAGVWIADDGEVAARWSAGPRGSIRLVVQGPADADRVSAAFGCRPGERLYGLGARPDGTDHTGKTVLLYSAEQGIGQDDYDLDEFDILRGRLGDSYYPVPWVVGSGGWGVGVMGDEAVEVDLCSPGLSELRFSTWSNRLELLLFPSGSARQAVADWTIATGPPAPTPAWTWGPWIGVQRGTDELLAAADRLRVLGIPATALWAQDWIGGRANPLGGGYDLYYHWEWDPVQYPDLPAAIDSLHDDGYAFLGYFNPFLTEPFDELAIALERGWVPRRESGEPYTFSIVDRFGSVVDLANPEAVDWTFQYLLDAAQMGQDGWMCDFGEWMPFEAQLAGGLTGAQFHNRYPVAWHEVNMAALDAYWGAGNALCFGRSGWTGDHAITPVTWGGDQETSFARDDGIPTAREIGVGLGLSGVARYGSDIAGFSSVHDGPSTRELYLRWIAMGAWEPVMRTHDGLAEEANWHFESDAETLALFRDYARLHMRLQPLWEALDRQYVQQGLPMMRHGVLVAPDEPEVRDAPDQHFLGDDILVAPVMTEAATERSVVLPEGSWFPWDGGEALPGGAHTVAAPVGTLPVFVRAGAMVPLADPDVVTSYSTSSEAIVDAGDRAGRVDLLAFAGGSGRLQLADGAVFDLDAEQQIAAGGVTYEDGASLDRACESLRDWSCTLGFDASTGVAEYRVDWGTGRRTLTGTGWTLEVSGGAGLRGVLTLRF